MFIKRRREKYEGKLKGMEHKEIRERQVNKPTRRKGID
jgi:hypothetical protein